MIRAVFQRDESGRIVAFRMTGHAAYAKAGKDILCAGVSAVAQTVIGSLQDIAGVEPEYHLKEGDIGCRVTYPEDDRRALMAATLMESARTGCLQIQESYGKTHLTVRDEDSPRRSRAIATD